MCTYDWGHMGRLQASQFVHEFPQHIIAKVDWNSRNAWYVDQHRADIKVLSTEYDPMRIN